VSEPTDDELMMQVQAGDPEPLGMLFERYQVPLYNFFLRLVGDAATSEDLVQECFLRILKYRHTYRGQNRFRTWLYQIARNARVDLHRKRWRETPLPETAGEVLPSREPSASDVLEETQRAALVRTALERLPEDRREVLVLSRYGEMRYEEIGRVLGCSEGAVKVRVHRAMKELRGIVQELVRERVP
jgi:RNA polymerase sigma-70 factor (ECF subfamily)